MIKFLTVIIALAFVGCAAKKERVVSISDGSNTLTYNCNNVQPQAKSQTDVLTVMMKSADVIIRAREEDDIALARSLKAARELKDIRRLEELIVADECKRAN